MCVNKPVRIYSVEGAARTSIDSDPSTGRFAVTVDITADGAVFGANVHGFTITGGNAIGVAVDLDRLGYTGGRCDG